jgi:hypothetical protein
VATFVVRRTVAAPAGVAWATLTDWPLHGRWVPLTTVTVERDTGGVGTRFVGRTGLGPLAFDDPMEVVQWEPPAAVRVGRCLLRKRGDVVLGWARIEVRPISARRCAVSWAEDVEIAPAAWTGWAGPLVSAAGRVVFGVLLWGLAREARRRAARTGRTARG